MNRSVARQPFAADGLDEGRRPLAHLFSTVVTQGSSETISRNTLPQYVQVLLAVPSFANEAREATGSIREHIASTDPR